MPQGPLSVHEGSGHECGVGAGEEVLGDEVGVFIGFYVTLLNPVNATRYGYCGLRLLYPKRKYPPP